MNERERLKKKQPEDVVCDGQLLSRDWGREKLSCTYETPAINTWLIAHRQQIIAV